MFFKRKLVKRTFRKCSVELNEQMNISRTNIDKHFESILKNENEKQTAQNNNAQIFKPTETKNWYKWAILAGCAVLSLALIILGSIYFQDAMSLFRHRGFADNSTNAQTKLHAGMTENTGTIEPSTPSQPANTLTQPTNAPTQSTNTPTQPTNTPTQPTNPPTQPSNTPTLPTIPQASTMGTDATEPDNSGPLMGTLPYLIEISMQELEADKSLSSLISYIPVYLPYDMSVYRIGKTVNEKLPPLYIFIGNKERSIIYTIGNIPETTPAPNYVMCEDITGGALKEIASVFDNRITAFEQVIAGDKLIGMSTTWVLSEEDYDEIAVMLQSLEQK